MAKRTTLRSSKGTKLYAKRNKKGQFEDIQTYKRAHGQDIKRKSTAVNAPALNTLQMGDDVARGLGARIGQINGLSGGLAGLAKTAAHEWPEVQCKAIDLDAEFPDLAKAAQAIVKACENFMAYPSSAQDRETIAFCAIAVSG